MNIQLYMTRPVTKALGPFERYAIWVQGCQKRCPGCISPDAQPINGGYEMSVRDLADDILSTRSIEGITISGGEPFLQQESLCELIDEVRAVRNLGVIVYTGVLFSEIQDTQLARRCDLIIDGEYIEALNDDRSLRGSSNQKAVCVTDRYQRYIEQYYGIPGRKVEFCIDSGNINMIGIPIKAIAKEVNKGV